MPKSANFAYNTYPGIPSGIENVTLSDTVTFTGVKGFVPNLDGTLAVTMEDGSSGTMIVKAGIQYSGAVKSFKSTGSVTVTAVTVFY